MLSAPTLRRLTSITVFLDTAPGMRGGQPAEERLTAGTQLPALVPELQEGEVRLRVAAAARDRAHALRARLAEVWVLASEDQDAALESVNALLAETGALRLVADADGAVDLAPAQTPADAVERLTAMAALALAEAALEGELDRLRTCAGEDCENTLVDASRNRSKRFCDAANCANRTHVRSYRARQAEAGEETAAPAVEPATAAGDEHAEAAADVVAEGQPKKKARKKDKDGKKSKKKGKKKAKKKGD
ncbi:CGNR zinc finger domain-containing protein [uncultured Micrococcus sp.]|uniref:CGNR zinc finger domain-containing protein n=1 Tax=uncultured Micrococcus sp. TaxID=114051 RepID=UPI0025E641F0|nr:CGNR zinc finger domain-containing protein [uncultured Micrococcus sp.]